MKPWRPETPHALSETSVMVKLRGKTWKTIEDPRKIRENHGRIWKNMAKEGVARFFGGF